MRGQCTAALAESHVEAILTGKTPRVPVLQGLRRRGFAAWGGRGRDRDGHHVPLTPMGRWLRGRLKDLAVWRREAERQAKRAEKAERAAREWERVAKKAARDATQLAQRLEEMRRAAA